MRVVPHLIFQGDRAAALDLWAGAFPDLMQSEVGNGVIEITLAGQTISLFDSPQVHDFGFTPAFSLFVDVDTAAEVDRLARLLGDGGTTMMPVERYDFAERFVWLADKFGVNWQIRYIQP